MLIIPVRPLTDRRVPTAIAEYCPSTLAYVRITEITSRCGTSSVGIRW